MMRATFFDGDKYALIYRRMIFSGFRVKQMENEIYQKIIIKCLGVQTILCVHNLIFFFPICFVSLFPYIPMN